MTTIVHLALATIERALPRVASAVILLAFASFTNPSAVGIYSWVALSYTFYQAIVENIIRNQAIMSIGNSDDMAYVAKFSRGAAIAGGTFLTLTLIILWYAYRANWPLEVALLTPFIAVPFITRLGISSIAHMQYLKRWNLLARYQLIAAVGGLAASFTTVILTHTSLAMAVHVVCTETIFLILCRRNIAGETPPTDRESRHPRREAASLAWLGGLGWSQGQLERVLIGSFAGVGTLGLYSTASTMGRSPGEALATATSNYLRASVSALPEDADHAPVIRRVCLIAVGASSLATLGIVVLVDYVFQPILGPTWTATLEAVPILAVATVPYAASLGLQTMSIVYQRPKASIIPAVAALCFAGPVALVALNSITLAAYAVVCKEVMVLVVCAVMARIPGSRDATALACTATLLMMAVVTALSL